MANRVLWMRGGALGDFILGLPTLLAIARDLRPAALLAVGPRRWLPLLDGLGVEVGALEDAPWVDLGGPREVRGPLGVELAVVQRVDPEGVLAGALRRAGVPRVWSAPPFPTGPEHAAAFGLGVLGLPARPLTADLWPRLVLTAAERGQALAAWDAIGPAPRVLLLPGSGGRGKCWPAASFVALAEALVRRGWSPAVALGPVELERGAAAPFAAAGIPLLPGLGLRALGAALDTSDVAVGNDAGTTHLAVMAGCPTVALFGPTDPRRWAPVGAGLRVLMPPVACGAGCVADPRGVRRCGERGPGDAARCLEDLAVEAVLSAVEDHLAAGRAELS